MFYPNYFSPWSLVNKKNCVKFDKNCLPLISIWDKDVLFANLFAMLKFIFVIKSWTPLTMGKGTFTVHNKRFCIFIAKIVVHTQKTTNKPVLVSKKSCYKCLKWNGAIFSCEMTGATFLILEKNCFPCCASLISFCVYFAWYIVGVLS